jgi:hypothetical protein
MAGWYKPDVFILIGFYFITKGENFLTTPKKSARILSKITALTMIQYLNLFVFHRNMNSIKIIFAKCTTGNLNKFLPLFY